MNYRRLGDLDFSQVNEWIAVMLSAILQLGSQGEGRKSELETLLMGAALTMKSRTRCKPEGCRGAPMDA